MQLPCPTELGGSDSPAYAITRFERGGETCSATPIVPLKPFIGDSASLPAWTSPCRRAPPSIPSSDTWVLSIGCFHGFTASYRPYRSIRQRTRSLEADA